MIHCVFSPGSFMRWQDWIAAPICAGHVALLTEMETAVVLGHFVIEREAELRRGHIYNGKHAVGDSEYSRIWERVHSSGECR